MVQIREVSNSFPAVESDSEYEDISETEFSDNIAPLCPYLAYLPAWLRIRPLQWSVKLYDRIGMLMKKAGSIAWVFTTSMLLVGLPVLFAYDREKALQEQQLGGLPSPLPSV